MKVRWITEYLGTAAAGEVVGESSFAVIDSRALIDGVGNSAEIVRDLIDVGVSSLVSGKKTVICCDHGMSRSNAIAAGVLSIFQKIDLMTAVRLVQDSTGETDIKPGPLNAVISALNEPSKSQLTGSGAVLLTGAGGAIGSSLLASRAQKSPLITPSHRDLDLCAGSTRLQMLVKESGSDIIVHLACPPLSATNASLGSSLTMLKNVLDVCVSENVHLIFPSCSDVYFGYRGALCADEGVTRKPAGHRGESKHLAEVLIEHYRETYALRCTILRLARIYGTGPKSPRFLHNLIERGKKKLPLEIHLFENSEARLDLLHVEDAVTAISRCLDYPFDDDFNLGSGTTTSTHEIACIIRERYSANSEIHRVRVLGQTSVVSMDHRKASEHLGWFPKKQFIEWLSETC